jgi:thiamine kinase-like enzyme
MAERDLTCKNTLDFVLCRTFIRDWRVWQNINMELTRKIKRILFMNIEHSKPEFLMTIIHNSLTKSKLWFKYIRGEPSEMKIIDWQGTKIGSPVFDFGRILLTNMPETNNLSKLASFCQRMLSVYVNSLKEHQDSFSTEFLMGYTVKLLIFSYIDLYISHDQRARSPSKMLHVFDDIAVFE